MSLRANTLWMAGGQALRAGVQFLYFALIARALGSEQYGAFIAVTALIGILAPFASWGSGNLLIKHVARTPALFPTYWGSALLVTGLSSLLLTALVLGAAQFALPVGLPALLIVLIAVSDLGFARLLDLSGQAFQAYDLLSRTSALQLLLAVLRLVAAAALGLSGLPPSALSWAGLYLAASALSAGIGLWWVRRELGWGPLQVSPVLREFREGGAFALSLSAQSIYNDVDKTMLARLVSTEAAGVYAAGYRVIDAMFTPVRSLIYAAYARFFRVGQEGIARALAFALRLIPRALGFGILAAGAVVVAAPAIPLVFGEDFRPSVAVAQWLAPLLILRPLHYFFSDTLTSSGYQTERSALQFGVAGLNVLSNLYLIPRFGVQGAVWSSLLCDLTLLVLAAALVGWKRRLERQRPALAGDS
nr:oligosaccharide flippase family protein [Deinococcus koreensis]